MTEEERIQLDSRICQKLFFQNGLNDYPEDLPAYLQSENV